MRKILFIINPVAGKGKTIELLPIIKTKFEHVENIDMKIVVSKYRLNVTELTVEYQAKGYYEIIGVGGDGTLSEIINGLDYQSESKMKVGIIPCGTGNDFIRSLDRDYELNCILDRIVSDETMDVDIGKVNEFHFINICSFGIDGPIVRDTEKFKKIIAGSPAYLFSTLKSGLFFKAKKVNLIIDNFKINKKLILVAIGNGKYFGGGMKVCPGASPNNGQFQICTVNAVNKITFMKELSKIYNGKLEDVKEVHYYDGREILVDVEEEGYLINADGNLVGSTPARITLIKSAVKFF